MTKTNREWWIFADLSRRAEFFNCCRRPGLPQCFPTKNDSPGQSNSDPLIHATSRLVLLDVGRGQAGVGLKFFA